MGFWAKPAVAVMATLVALTQPADAQRRDGPGAFLDAIFSPIGQVLDRVDQFRRGSAHRQSGETPPRPPASIAGQPRPAAPVATAPSAEPSPPAAKENSAAASTSSTVAAINPAGATPPEVSTTGTVESAAPKPPASTTPDTAARTPQRLPLQARQGDEPTSRAGRSQRPSDTSSQPARQPYRFGMAGPLAWPNAYEDIIGHAFWPKEYGERIRSHGIGDVLYTIFAPGLLTARNRANNPAPARTAAAAASSPCGASDQAAPDWPASQIERSIKLTPEHRNALSEFKNATGEALKSIRATCGDEAAMTPVERLRRMQVTLWAVHDALIRIRAPLAKFHGSLTDEQKRQFVLSPAESDPVRALATAGPPLTADDYARMCGLPKMDDGGMQHIEQNLRPDKAQRASLESIQAKAGEMGRFLMASCLQPVPQTPVERLDAGIDRVTAVIFATSNISLALNDLFGQLTSEQKSRMSAFGR